MSNNYAMVRCPKRTKDFCPQSASDLESFILSLAAHEGLTAFAPILEDLAKSIHVTAFGFDEKEIEEKVLFALYDHDCLEIENLCELLKMPEKSVLPVVDRLISENVVRTEKRRRWQEPGKHYNPIYYLVD